MSIGGFIQDGTGKGFLAQVNSGNQLSVRALTETEFVDQSEKGESFNVNTGFVQILVGTETPLLYFSTAEANNVALVAWFIGLGLQGGVPTENALLRVYANPTGVSGGVAITPQNRRIGSPRSFAFTALRQDAGSPLLATPPASPLLFQTQTPSSRVFGEVNLTLPRLQSVLVTIQPNGAQPINCYTGFSGYVLPDTDA